MESVALESLQEDKTFNGDLCIDNNFILLPVTCPMTKELLVALKEWEFTSLNLEESLFKASEPEITQAPAPATPLEPTPQENNTADQDTENNSTNNSEEISAKSFTVPANTNVKIGSSVKEVIESSKSAQLPGNDAARLDMVQKVYDEYMNYIEKVFTFYITNKQINQDELSDTVKELCMFIKDHRRYILRINPSEQNCNKNFLVMHSMRTTVLAIVIAMQLHMPLSKMVELGITCILHEIGMLKLPPQIYMTTKTLTLGEKTQIFKHPLYGYSIAKDMQFPLAIQLGILEHHEKENGTGYPRRLSGDKISINAKIISVACSYEAITAPRSYKDERSAFLAILELIKNENHQYDDMVIKALLYSVSLFPIGSYVYLSNKKVAIVIDANPSNPKFPIVQSISDKDENGELKIIQTSQNDISIVRILTKSEQSDIIKILNERYNSIKEAQEIAASNPVPEQKPVEHTQEEIHEMVQKNGQIEEVDISLFS